MRSASATQSARLNCRAATPPAEASRFARLRLCDDGVEREVIFDGAAPHDALLPAYTEASISTQFCEDIDALIDAAIAAKRKSNRAQCVERAKRKARVA